MRSLIGACAVAAALGGAGCDRALGVTPLDDVGFVVSDAGTVEGPDADEVAPGCSLLRPQICDRAGSVCCAEPTARCVPGADGTNVCVAAGIVAEGEACGLSGLDDCAASLLCAAADSGGSPVCRRLCDRVVALCPDGGSCAFSLEAAGQTIGLCVAP